VGSACLLASGLNDAEFVSHLLVDLLDRKLYERANDCRRWALSPELRLLLAGSLPERGARMERILKHINGLYTVYTAIVVYDRHGVIVAATVTPVWTGSTGPRSGRCCCCAPSRMMSFRPSPRRRCMAAGLPISTTPRFAHPAARTSLSAGSVLCSTLQPSSMRRCVGAGGQAQRASLFRRS
jgi:hypothetical protein